ncbi:pectin lyase fold/virulence factor [Xylariales sp. PMI_506]|nr:pectin lyase fold/virulence factor [Xylariales sp. PMI_506]
MVVLVAGLLATASLILPAAAQLSGTVGPTTTTSSKAAVKQCNIMDYGGEASATTDNSAAIASAWAACASGGEVVIPAGDYGLETWLTLKDGKGVAINLEGTIYRTGTAGGNMILIESSSDIELYSSTSAGAIQAYGYEFHKEGEYGARILRFADVTDFSIHDIILVDAPQFHLSLDTCTNGEVYNMIIHGGNEGGLDGIDVWGTNIWIHDIEVSNKDECVTVKDPSSNLLIEQIHCNWSGGCAMGSLASGIDIHDIEYNNVYTHGSNQMYMIKSNGGSGDVYNVALNNFWGHSNAYTLDFDTAWSSMDVVSGDGINYSNISFSGWRGTASNGVQRGPIKLDCPAEVPCTDITVEDFAVWTDSGSEVLYVCQNAYGSGACMESSGTTSYTTTQTVTSVSGYSVATMANELTTGFDISSSIPIPTMPQSFFPGSAPISAILAYAASTADAAAVASTSTSAAAASSTTTANASSTTAKAASAASSLSTLTTKTTTKAASSSATSKATTASASSSSKTSAKATKQTKPASFGNGKAASSVASSSAAAAATTAAAGSGCGKNHARAFPRQ